MPCYCALIAKWMVGGLLRVLAVMARYGPHLMIVMIFVTQNNFSDGPGIFRPSPWILPNSELDKINV